MAKQWETISRYCKLKRQRRAKVTPFYVAAAVNEKVCLGMKQCQAVKKSSQ